MEKSLTDQKQYFYQNRKWRWRVEGLATVVIYALALLLFVVVVVQAGDSAGVNVVTRRLLPNALMVGFIAIPAALIMASGSYDLSVGGVISLTVALIALGERQILPAVIGAFLIALLVGALNGALVAVTRINGAIVTLITMLALRGLSRYLFRVVSIATINSPILESLPHSPLLWVLLIILAIAMLALVYFTPLGKRPQRDESVGKRLLFVGLPYVFSSFFAVITALIMVGLFRVAMPEIGTNIEVDVLIAVLVGGTAFGAGVAFIPGALAGALVAAAITTLGLTVSINSSPAIVDLLKGGLVLVVFLWATTFHYGVNWYFRRRTETPEEAEEVESADGYHTDES